MATCQSFVFAMISVAENRSDRVDDVLRTKLAAACDHGISRRQSPDSADDRTAFLENGRSASTMNRAIHSTTAEQGRVRCIHDPIGGFLGDVTEAVNLDDLVVVQQQSHNGVC